MAADLAVSRGAARRLVQQGGVRIDGGVQGDEVRTFVAGAEHEIRVGKRQGVRVRLE
jgi:tyrosyl-tRNA synthetase